MLSQNCTFGTPSGDAPVWMTEIPFMENPSTSPRNGARGSFKAVSPCGTPRGITAISPGRSENRSAWHTKSVVPLCCKNNSGVR